ncbi:MAG: NAD-dependent epimerase/dehydratase family protein [Oscillospiraceae bacterium]|nr:NAD-dependent epimerase/dehydratase family protein [Oscillospiraceae bacterium]
MKVLVTGANGFLGTGIVRALLDHGADVAAAGRSTELTDRRAERYEGDIFELTDPWETFGRPDVLLHLAWRDGFVHDSPAHMADLPRHEAFIRAFAESGVKKIAVMGSMHEAGRFEGCIGEDTPCAPANAYGAAKYALRQFTEAVCREHGKLFEWLRGYYIVAADPRGASVFSKLAAAEAAGQATFPFTSGQNAYDFLDYDEFCRRTALAVLQDEVLGVIEICSGQPEKLADRVERFIRDNGYHIRLDYGAYPDRPYDVKAVWGDGSRIGRILGGKQ